MLEKKIKFISEYEGYIPSPQPALLSIPKEYKEMRTFYDESASSKTVKKCIPFLDALTCGYVIPFPIDYSYRYDEEETKAIFEINDNIRYPETDIFKIHSHANEQVPKNVRYNRRTVEAIFKFHNPWIIKTPPGYSCIFTQPFNRNSPFKIIDGIVDTDTYDVHINFPFYWSNAHNEKVILEKGSPMALVIPFKRDSWKMECVKESKKEVEQTRFKILKNFGNIKDSYKKIFWKKKKFR